MKPWIVWLIIIYVAGLPIAATTFQNMRERQCGERSWTFYPAALVWPAAALIGGTVLILAGEAKMYASGCRP